MIFKFAIQFMQMLSIYKIFPHATLHGTKLLFYSSNSIVPIHKPSFCPRYFTLVAYYRVNDLCDVQQRLHTRVLNTLVRAGQQTHQAPIAVQNGPAARPVVAEQLNVNVTVDVVLQDAAPVRIACKQVINKDSFAFLGYYSQLSLTQQPHHLVHHHFPAVHANGDQRRRLQAIARVVQSMLDPLLVRCTGRLADSTSTSLL